MGKDRLRMVEWVIPPGKATSDQLILQGKPHEQNSPKLGCVFLKNWVWNLEDDFCLDCICIVQKYVC